MRSLESKKNLIDKNYNEFRGGKVHIILETKTEKDPVLMELIFW